MECRSEVQVQSSQDSKCHKASQSLEWSEPEFRSLVRSAVGSPSRTAKYKKGSFAPSFTVCNSYSTSWLVISVLGQINKVNCKAGGYRELRGREVGRERHRQGAAGRCE